MNKRDCFAYKQDRKCNVLIQMNCAKCKFYQKKEQFEIEAERAEKIRADHEYCDLCKKHELGECENCDLTYKK